MNTEHRPARAAAPAGRPLARLAALALLAVGCLRAGEEASTPAGPGAAAAPAPGRAVRSQPGENAWNVGRPEGNWWAEMERQHGHVGPWNVLGWRLGQAALRELNSAWGRHELEIVCYVPPQTPFTCLVDGVSVGTGNSLGRLDLRMAEVLDPRQTFVAVRRKDGRGELLEFRPQPAYLERIAHQPLHALKGLSETCAQAPEGDLFAIRRWSP